MGEKLGPLFQLYYRPSRALSTILDSGSLALALIVAAALGFAIGEISRVVLIAVLFAPACVAVISVWDHLGSVGVVLRRDYSPLLVCTLMCWIAANIPAWLASFLMPAVSFWIHIVADAYFLALAAVAIRTVFGSGVGKSIGTALGGAAASVGGFYAYAIFGGALSYFASPLVLIWLYILFRPNLDMFTGFGGGLRSRQNFNRHLEALTVNPRDSDAQYQLGLIYQQRRNYAEAISRGDAQGGFLAWLEQQQSLEARRHPRLGAVWNGFYAQHLGRFLRYFPAEQVRCYWYEQLCSAPGLLVKDVCSFLGVDPSRRIDVSRRHNVTMQPRSRLLIKATAPLAPLVRRVMPQPVVAALRTLRTRRPPRMTRAERIAALSIYQDDIRELQVLLGRDLSAWLTA